jgi:uncharacterized integral membrane protein (TIGR00698 family)
MAARVLFFLILLFLLTPWASPPLALALGLVLGLSIGNPFPKQSKKFSRTLLQLCVIGLGFGMNLHQVVKAGRSGFVYTAIGITFTMLLGYLLGKILRVQQTESTLISVGTSICGGSAIAAVGPVIGATDEQMSVSLGTVFILNSVALLTFPLLGAALHLDQTQFGLWAALAIHDTSSVVGAGVKYGAVALAVATTVKLARALWIVPVSLGAAALKHERGRKIQWPWFIAFFVLAACIATYVPAPAVYKAIVYVARIGLTITLFLIGSNVSRATLREVGFRPLLQGVLLWIIVASVTLQCIRVGWIAL